MTIASLLFGIHYAFGCFTGHDFDGLGAFIEQFQWARNNAVYDPFRCSFHDVAVKEFTVGAESFRDLAMSSRRWASNHVLA